MVKVVKESEKVFFKKEKVWLEVEEFENVFKEFGLVDKVDSGDASDSAKVEARCRKKVVCEVREKVEVEVKV